IENVKRLRNHPSLALWCGNNEDLLVWYKYNWKSRYPREVATKLWDDYKNLFLKMLPGIVNEYDPKTAYWPSSPSSYYNKIPDKKSGDEHEWRIWYETAPFSAYADRPGRFVSEYGLQSFPCLKTLHTFANDSDLDVHSSLMEFRQRSKMPWINPSMNGNQMMSNYIQMYYNDPSGFESFVYVSQVAQSEALKAAIEAHRINRPRCMGSLYWQLNDCWPTMSWSTIDYYGLWKPAHYAVRRAFANVAIIPELTNGRLNVYAVNDSLASMKAELRLKVMDFTGNGIWNFSDTLTLNSDTAQLLWKGHEYQVCPKLLNFKVFLLAQLVVKGKVIAENTLTFIDPKYLDLLVPDISFKVTAAGDHFDVTVIADKFAKNVFLDTYEKSAQFSDNNFDLLPGREIRLSVIYPGTSGELQNDLKIYSLADSY
ncbi:MAG TPA: glycoside hydrolase family 2 protein, partial [Bacteroidales bacterium]